MDIVTKPFTKLFSSIITSSIWNENDKVRVLWVTMLALSDRTGHVCASVGGLAHAARISKEDCEAALGYLSSPDDDSRSIAFEGRRVEFEDGGFRILNYTKYREIGRAIDRTEYLAAKKRESRSRKRQQTSTPVNTKSTDVDKASTISSASASASASVSREKKEGTAEQIYSAYPRKIGRPKALMAIRGALRCCKADDLLQKTKAYASAVAGADMQFIPYPATWFNQQRFNDDPREWARSSTNGKQQKPMSESDKAWIEKHGIG